MYTLTLSFGLLRGHVKNRNEQKLALAKIYLKLGLTYSWLRAVRLESASESLVHSDALITSWKLAQRAE